MLPTFPGTYGTKTFYPVGVLEQKKRKEFSNMASISGHGVLLDESNPTPYYAQDYDQTYDQPTAPYTGNTAEAGGVWV